MRRVVVRHRANDKHSEESIMSFMNEIITCGNVQCERERPKPVLLLGRPPPPSLLSHPFSPL